MIGLLALFQIKDAGQIFLVRKDLTFGGLNIVIVQSHNGISSQTKPLPTTNKDLQASALYGLPLTLDVKVWMESSDAARS